MQNKALKHKADKVTNTSNISAESTQTHEQKAESIQTHEQTHEPTACDTLQALQAQRVVQKYRITRFVMIMILMLSLAQNVNYYLKYNRLQELYIECYTEKALPKPKEREAISLGGIKTQGINKEYKKLDSEVVGDLQSKAEHLHAIDALDKSDVEMLTQEHNAE